MENADAVIQRSEANSCVFEAVAAFLMIGLNVKADNTSAIACCQRLDFKRIADYREYSLESI